MTAAERLARQVAAADNIEQAKAAAARVLARRPRIAKAPPPERSRDERREEHRASTGDLRAQVWERCGGRCEVSGVELGAAWEMHHVQGAGERRSRQRPGNVLAVSWDVHRLIHRNDLETLRAVAACPVLDAEARRAAQRRVDKVIEAQGVPVRIEVES